MNYKWKMTKEQRAKYDEQVVEGQDFFLDAASYASHVFMGENGEKAMLSYDEFNELLDTCETDEQKEQIVTEKKYRQDLFNNLDWTGMIGDTPLEKAINTVKLTKFIEQENQNPDAEGNCKPNKSSKGGTGTSKSKSAGQKTAGEVNSLSDALKQQNALKEKIEQSEKQEGPMERALGKGGKGEDNSTFISLNHYDINSLTPEHLKALRNFKKYSDKLNFKASEGDVIKDMTMTKNPPENADPSVVYSFMDDVQDITAVPEVMFIDPLWKLHLVQNEIMIPFYWNVTPTKRMVFAFVDNSGSMSDERKIAYVKTIITHYVAEVANGDTELYVMRFVEDYTAFHKVDRPSKVKKITNEYFNFNGGGTEVGEVIKIFAKEVANGRVSIHGEKGIEKAELTHMKEARLIIVNDGQDTISPHALDSLIEQLRASGINVIVNAFAIGAHNEYLEELCTATKGYYNYIPL